MSPRLAILVILLIMAVTPFAHAGQMSTYIQGTVIKRTKSYWVVETDKGRVWINVKRHPSYTRRVNAIEIGFWVQVRHLKRIRPNATTAAHFKGAQFIIN